MPRRIDNQPVAAPRAGSRPSTPASSAAPAAPEPKADTSWVSKGKGWVAQASEKARVLNKNDRAIEKLSDAQLAATPPAQKVEMLRTLLSVSDGKFFEKADALMGRGSITANLNPLPTTPKKQETIVRILQSAKDGASLDFMLSRVNGDRLMSALTGKADKTVRKMIEDNHASVKPGDWKGYAEYLEGATGTKPSGKNQLEFLVDGAEVKPKAKEMIASAKESINLSVFQLQPDAVGFDLAERLGKKVAEGVKVRVLLDKYGSDYDSKEDADRLVKTMKDKGIEVVLNHAPLTKGSLDHRKVLVVDGKQGFTGGMNIGRHYQEEWHDQQTLVRGPAVTKLQDAFLDHWAREGGKPLSSAEREKMYPPLTEANQGAPTWVVAHEHNGKDRNIKTAYLRAIQTAEKSIRVANPYFSDPDVVKELCAAAKRGVDVAVVLPEKNDQAILKSAAEAYYPEMLAAGVKVYEYQPRMAHQKVAVIDGKWATVGSSNLDARSLEFNDELNLVVIDPKFASDIEKKMFDVDLPQSKRITTANPSLKGRLARKLDELI